MDLGKSRCSNVDKIRSLGTPDDIFSTPSLSCFPAKTLHLCISNKICKHIGSDSYKNAREVEIQFKSFITQCKGLNRQEGLLTGNIIYLDLLLRFRYRRGRSTPSQKVQTMNLSLGYRLLAVPHICLIRTIADNALWTKDRFGRELRLSEYHYA